jgi:hypothetical protein
LTAFAPAAYASFVAVNLLLLLWQLLLRLLGFSCCSFDSFCSSCYASLVVAVNLLLLLWQLLLQSLGFSCCSFESYCFS